jgi:hypothetical protein
MTQVQQVNADLVRPSRVQLGAEEVRGPPSLLPAEVGACLPSTFLHNGHAGSLRGMAADRGIHGHLVGGKVPPARSQVAAADAPLPELVRETAVGCVVLGNQHKARGVAIQSVHDARAEHTSDSRQISHRVQQCMHQRA